MKSLVLSVMLLLSFQARSQTPLPFKVEGKVPKNFNERSAQRAYDIAVIQANKDINGTMKESVRPSIIVKFGDETGIKDQADGTTLINMKGWSAQYFLDGVYIATWFRVVPSTDKRREALRHMVSAYNALIDWREEPK